MSLRLLRIAPVDENRYRLAIDADGRETEHTVEYQTEFIPMLIIESGDSLRPVLLNNPRAMQPVIEAIQDLRAGRTVGLPVSLPQWVDAAKTVQGVI